MTTDPDPIPARRLRIARLDPAGRPQGDSMIVPFATFDMTGGRGDVECAPIVRVMRRVDLSLTMTAGNMKALASVLGGPDFALQSRRYWRHAAKVRPVDRRRNKHGRVGVKRR